MKIVQNHTNCNTCNTELSNKNWHLSSFDKKLYFVRSQCIHCHRKASFCYLRYDNKKLEKLSKIQNKKIASRINYVKNIKPKKKTLRKKHIPPIICKKCKITLCDKNEVFISGYKNSKCKSCTYNCKSCTVIYPNDRLKKLSMVQYKKIASKINKIKNPKKAKEAVRNSVAKHRSKYYARSQANRDNLADVYIVSCIKKMKSISIASEEVTPQLIEIKRKELEIKRKLKN